MHTNEEMGVVPFKFHNWTLRAVSINQEPYFVALDVCRVIGIKNSRDVIIRTLDQDEKAMSKIPTQFGVKEMHVVNESGLYHLIFRSNKPEAKAFRKWVTTEVLPTLRKTGRFEVAKEGDASPIAAAMAVLERINYISINNFSYYGVAELAAEDARFGKLLDYSVANKGRLKKYYGNHALVIDGQMYMSRSGIEAWLSRSEGGKLLRASKLDVTTPLLLNTNALSI